MATSEFTKITQTERDNYGVKALSNRPNETGLYGVGGLTAQQLKEWFDKYANLLADRFNALCDIFHGENSADVAQYIKLPNFGSYETLRDVLTAISDGTFADTMMAYASASAEEASSLQSIINSMAATLSIVITTSNYTSYIVDALNSDDATKALSAKQGKALKTDVDLKIAIASIVDNLTTNDATKVLSAKQGKALKDLLDTLSSTSASSYGTTLDFSVDTSTYVLTVKLKNSSGTVLSTATVDLPLELLKVNASYANGVLTLNIKSSDNSVDNAPIEIDISDLISGLVNSADIADNLTTDDATKVLSAKQGKKLNDEKIDKTSIADDLVTDDATKVLSAKQGKKLSDEKIDKTSIVDNLTSDDDTKVLSAKQGKAIKTYTDGQVTAVNTKITDDRIRIANLENSVYNFILGKKNETFSALKSAVLPSGITIDETLYAIADGARGILSSIKGNTKQFNQLVNKNNFAASFGVYTNNDDGTVTVNGTNTSSSGSYYTLGTKQLIAGHKYLLKGCPSNITGASLWIERNSILLAEDTGSGSIFDVSSTDNYSLYIRVASGATINNKKFIPQLHDLTAMDEASSTVSAFSIKYPKVPYPFNAGTLYDSVISGLGLTGRNLWDEETKQGYYSNTDGTYVSQSGQLCTKNPISVLPNTTYYAKVPNLVGIRFYDASGNYISSTTCNSNSTFTTVSGCYFINISFTATYGGTYNNDICINVSDASFNGTYAPYELRSITIPSAQTLGGVGTAQDEWQVTRNDNDEYYTIKKIVRVTNVNLGTLNWTYNSSANVFYSDANTFQKTGTLNIISDKLKSCGAYIGIDTMLNTYGSNSIGTANNQRIYVATTDYTDAISFKTAMNGVTATIELATPVETTITTTATLAEVSTIRKNGGMISVQGNDDNEDYVQPDVDVRVTYKIPQTGGES